MKAQFFFNLT